MPFAFPAFRRDAAPAQGGRSPGHRAALSSPEVPAPACEKQRDHKSCRDAGFRYFESFTDWENVVCRPEARTLFLRPCSVLIGSEKIEPKGLIQTLMQGWASSCSLGGGGSSLQDKGLRWGGLDRGRDILFAAKTSLHPNHSRGAQFRAKATAGKDSLSNRCYKQLRNVRESEQRETNVKMH